MSKQTAVEYLVEQLESIGFSINDLADYYNEVQIALEMEKEQMKDVYLTHCVKAERLRKIFEQQFDDYYNETYGGNND